jgi:hypothetical protein
MTWLPLSLIMSRTVPSIKNMLTWASASLLTIIMLIFLFPDEKSEESISVAFIGNSFQFVNDLPRFMEQLSLGKIEQDSVLHGSLSFVSLLENGNGMYRRWNTSNAVNDQGFHDVGSCTVPQLLLGHDDRLDYFQDYYTNDGLNPCFQDNVYFQYAENVKNRPPTGTGWDFVVLNDQSMRPAYPDKQGQSVNVLQQNYAPLLRQSGSTPVLLMTYGYWREDINMTDLVDVPTFTSLLYEGYLGYAEALHEILPSTQQTRIAPVGLAFLVIWEENYSVWTTLFGEDWYHPSPSGTYLMGCVLYITLFNRLPPAATRFTSSLWRDARSMQLTGDDQPLPNSDEALYLRWIAKRVTLQGYIPKSLEKGAGVFG